MTVEFLHAYGRYAEPCDCDYQNCQGWIMGFQWEDAIVVRGSRSQTEYGLDHNARIGRGIVEELRANLPLVR